MRKLNPDPGNLICPEKKKTLRELILWTDDWSLWIAESFQKNKNPDPYSMNPDPQRFKRQAAIRLGDNQCFGSGMFIPDLDFFQPRSRVRKKPEPEFGSPTMIDKAFKNLNSIYCYQDLGNMKKGREERRKREGV
jgi:hypothetical protein